MPVMELKNVTKTYKMAGGGTFEALRGISASFEAGEPVSYTHLTLPTKA